MYSVLYSNNNRFLVFRPVADVAVHVFPAHVDQLPQSLQDFLSKTNKEG